MPKLHVAVTVDSLFMLETLAFGMDVPDKSFYMSWLLEPDSNLTNKLLKEDKIEHFENNIQSSSVHTLNTK